MIFDPIIVKKGGGLPDNVRTITLTADPPEGGTVSGGGIASDGMKIIVEAEPSLGYAFDGWKENGALLTKENQFFLSVTDSHNLLAEFFEEQYHVGVDWWTGKNESLPYGRWMGAAYGDGHWAAVQGSMYADTFIYSDDGVNWTPALTYTGQWRGMAYNNGLFVTVMNGARTIAYSEDYGHTWKSSNQLDSSNWITIKFGGGIFVAISYATYLATSNDGKNWTMRSRITTSKGVNNILFGDGLWIVPYENTSEYVYSSNPASGGWQTGQFPITGNWYAGAYGNGKYVLLSYNQGTAVISEDGVNWQSVTLPLKAAYESLAFGGGIFVAASYDQSNKCIYSENGIDWKVGNLPSESNGYYTASAGNEDMVVIFPSTDNTYKASVYSSRKGPIE